MRTPEVEAALARIESAAHMAFLEGVTPRAIVWTAAAHANSGESRWPSTNGRALADRVCRAFDPPENKSAGPRPVQRAAWLARLADGLLRRFGWKVMPRD